MTKSRKRMLLSSIAMLLVALVALGSATYAWFTINKTVEANTINVKAATADGLQISNTQTANFVRVVSYNSAYTELKPVSFVPAISSAFPATGIFAEDVSKTNGGAWATSADAISGWKATATAPLSGNKTGEDTYTFNANDYAAVYTMQIQSSGAAIARNVIGKITVTNASTGSITDATTFVKAALVDSDNKVVLFWSDGTSYSPIATTGPTLGTAPAVTNNVKVLDSAPAKDSAATFKLVVWYEGNDENCTDAGQGAQANIKVEFSLAD